MSVKISELPAIDILATNDILPVRDTSASVTKSVTGQQITDLVQLSLFPNYPGVPDNTFRIVGSSDATKKVALEVDGLTPGVTRTITIPDRNLTLGPTLAGEQASTSGTSIDFTGIPSGTKRISILFVGVSTNGTTGYYVQLGDAGGIETSGYLSCTANIAGAGVGSSNFGSGFQVVASSSAATVVHGIVTLILENSSTNTWVCSGILAHSNTGQIDLTGGSKATSQELDRVRITAVNGSDTFDAGVINITYE